MVRASPRVGSDRRWALAAVASPVAASIVLLGFAVGDDAQRGMVAPPTPVASPGTMRVVAHQDDDLLFMNPDLHHDIEAGRGTTTVFVTAGDAGRPSGYWRTRELGTRVAAAQLVGAPNDWIERPMRINGREVKSATLAGRPDIRLVWLRVPDGNLTGGGFAATGRQSLERLWRREISRLHPVDGSEPLARDELVGLMHGLIQAVEPVAVATLDGSEQHECESRACGLHADHSDHQAVAWFATAAANAASVPVVAYQGYPMARRRANLDADDARDKLDAFLAYAAWDRMACQTARQCLADPKWVRYSHWLRRQYRVGQ